MINKKDKSILNIMIILALCYMLISGSLPAFIYSYIITFIYLVWLTFRRVITKWNKFLSLILYSICLSIQITIAVNMLDNSDSWLGVSLIERLFLMILIFAPLFVDRYIKFNENRDGGR
ncbi:hypothetical protein [Corticicoccus populi]|uniref:Uncharacterized protein n=1 Tax=Corticicoccus populi TaxID=1812821 RepID=A0ABW5WVD1_9STAP